MSDRVVQSTSSLTQTKQVELPTSQLESFSPLSTLEQPLNRLPLGSTNCLAEPSDTTGDLAQPYTAPNQNSNPLPNTLNFDASSAEIFDSVLSEIRDLLQSVRKYTLKDRKLPAFINLRANQTEVNRLLSEIQRLSIQTQINGVHILQGITLNVMERVGASGYTDLTMKKVDIQSLGLEGFSIAGPMAITSQPDSLEFLSISPADPNSIRVNLKIDGEPSTGTLVEDPFCKLFIKVAPRSVGNPSNVDKFYQVDEKNELVITKDIANTSQPLAPSTLILHTATATLNLDIHSQDLSTMASFPPVCGPKITIEPYPIFGRPKNIPDAEEQMVRRFFVTVKVNDIERTGKLVIDSLEKVFIRFSTGDSVETDSFYPISEDDISIVGCTEMAPPKHGLRIDATSELNISASDLLRLVPNGPQAVVEEAVAKIDALRQHLQKLV